MDDLIATMQAFLSHDNARADRAGRSERRGPRAASAAVPLRRLRIMRAGITLDLFGAACALERS